jgi:hypothetical protein
MALRLKNNEWRSSYSLAAKHKQGLASAIREDPRFGTHPKFVAWMDGVPLEGISSQEQAMRVSRQAAKRFGVRMRELLDEESCVRYVRESPALRQALEYLGKSRSRS